MNFYLKYLQIKKNITQLLDKPVSPAAVRATIALLHPQYVGKELIRIGHDHDGGYLIPNDLSGIEACFSAGVGDVSLFEYDCLQRGMKIFLADASVEKSTINLPDDSFDFLKKFIGDTTNDKFTTLESWVKESGVSEKSDLLLQMDIEEGEYPVLTHCSEDFLKRFRIISIEFHDMNFLNRDSFYKTATAIFKKLTTSHTCVHLHPNNYFPCVNRYGIMIPPLLEATFLRNDRVICREYVKQFPHPLDADNVVKNAHYPLPKDWYRAE